MTTDELGEITASIAEYVREMRGQIEVDRDIFESGLISSLFAMQLVLFLEQEFAITIGSEDLDLSNFRTISSMAETVDRIRHREVQADVQRD